MSPLHHLASEVLGVLPYVTVSAVGPLQPFGGLLVAGIIFGVYLTWRRARLHGLDGQVFGWLAFSTIFVGLVFSHVLDTIMYFPEALRRDPWQLLRMREGLSSFGGFAGATIGFLCYGRRQKLDLWRSGDAVLYGLPFGWFFGRLGCAIVHDHPGIRSDSFLAVAYPDGARFDLGLLEFMLTPLICAAVIIAGKLAKKPGAIIATLMLTYPLIRFPLDFLRAEDVDGGDVRYLGLTPGQYACIVTFLGGFYILHRRNKAAVAESVPKRQRLARRRA